MEISVPKFLHDIHGEKTSLSDLVLTYGGGLASAVIVPFLYAQSDLSLAWWGLLLLVLVSADIGAGAVANFTKATNQYYSGANKSKTRLVFIFAHFIHPAIFLYLVNSLSLYPILMAGYVIGATLLINSIGNREKQAVAAASFMVVGISLLPVLQIASPFLHWFFPLFMVKLFLAFGTRRYA